MPPPPIKWWLQPDTVKDLGLSETQVTQLNDSAIAGRKAEIELRAQTELSQVELDALMDRDPLDLKATEAAIDRFVQLHANFEKQRMLGLLHMRHILTKEQYLKLQQRFMERMATPKGRTDD